MSGLPSGKSLLPWPVQSLSARPSLPMLPWPKYTSIIASSGHKFKGSFCLKQRDDFGGTGKEKINKYESCHLVSIWSGTIFFFSIDWWSIWVQKKVSKLSFHIWLCEPVVLVRAQFLMPITHGYWQVNRELLTVQWSVEWSQSGMSGHSNLELFLGDIWLLVAMHWPVYYQHLCNKETNLVWWLTTKTGCPKTIAYPQKCGIQNEIGLCRCGKLSVKRGTQHHLPLHLGAIKTVHQNL